MLGGYLDRNTEQTQDYTNYSRGYCADYYQCYGPTSTAPAKCYSLSATWNDTERATHQGHELRVSTPDDWRVRAVAGAFLGGFQELRPGELGVSIWTRHEVTTTRVALDVAFSGQWARYNRTETSDRA